MRDTVASVPREVWQGASRCTDTDRVVVEVPVALVYNGLSHAVMMATPSDLEDLALGFSLSEHILQHPGQLLGVEVIEREQGLEVSMEITGEPFAGLRQLRRSHTGRSGCGLCGKESLAQAIPPVSAVQGDFSVPFEALQRALAALGGAQQLKAVTAGVHGAAWCDGAGDIRLLREDVGRHNALDKLLGAMASAGEGGEGFVLLTSRLGYEMVAKAAARGVAVLAAVSAPTSLALRQAEAAGMTLVGFLQPGRQVVYSGAQRIRGNAG